MNAATPRRQIKAESAISDEGRRLIKAMRQQILEAGRSDLEAIVQKHTGAEVVSVHSDISTKSGEWLDIFVLEIWIMNADGSNPMRLTQDQGPPIEDTPTLSPSGEKVAFVQDIVVESWDKVTHTKVKTTAGRRVTVMDVDGRNQVKLPVPEVPGDEWPSVRDPSCTSDGRRVAFMSYSQPSYMPGCDEHVFITNADGSGTPRIFPTPGPPGCPLWTPVWSPDGSQIAITAPGKNGPDNIYIMDASPAGATGRPRLITPDYLQGAKEPSWSPDGTEIAFVGAGSSSTQIYKIDVNSLEETPLTGGIWPTWSPDGEKIAFVGTDGAINVMDADGSNVTLIFDSAGVSVSEPVWQPLP